MIELRHRGDFSITYNFLNKIQNKDYLQVLEHYGQEGVKRLEEYTPKRTGLTSRSWSYEVKDSANKAELNFYNSNIQNGVNVAVIIQFGHGTARGYYIEGRDYINPALQPIFDDIAEALWKEVTR